MSEMEDYLKIRDAVNRDYEKVIARVRSLPAEVQIQIWIEATDPNKDIWGDSYDERAE